MTNKKDELPSLDSLDERIKQARLATEEPAQTPHIAKERSQALRAGTEILAGVGVGAFIGYYLDDQLGTRPWCLILLVFLGFAGGVMNLYRALAHDSESEAGETNPVDAGGDAPAADHKGKNAGE